MAEPTTDYEDLFDDEGHGRRKRFLVLALFVGLLAAGAYALWALVLSGGGSATAAVQTATVQLGTISQTVSTTGTVVAQSTTNLSFSQSGKVTAVNAKLGQEVKAGDLLAEIDSSDLQRALTTAQVSLSSAQTNLNQLLQGSTASQLAAADQSLVQAQASYNEAVTALQVLQNGPTAADQLAAQQAVTSAQAQLDQAKSALSDLTAPPSQADELAAQQAVTSAQSQLDQANRALADLQAPPTESELLSAQQAVTSAQAQLDSALSAQAALSTSNSSAIAAAQAAVAKAQNALNNAQATATNAAANLTSAGAALQAEEQAYCTLAPSFVPPPSPTPQFCGGYAAGPVEIAPGSDDEKELLQQKASATDPNLVAHASSVLAANTSYKGALATKTSADAAVTSAQADLASAQSDLTAAQAGPSSADIAKADAAVTAAQQALDAANAKLNELNAGPTASDLANAQEAVTTAQAGLDTAQAKLTQLNAGPTASDLANAQQAVVTASAGLATAQAKLAALNNPTPSDLQKAQDAVNNAAAALSTAQANHDQTYAGSTPDAIQLQRNQVALAQLSVESAQKNLDGAKLIAPYDGTVAALNIAVGDMAGASSTTAPIILNTPNAVTLNLTITESDLPSVKVGQSGIATFDALSGSVLPIVIDAVGTNPTTTQGVVTYQVRARFVAGATGAAPGAAAQGAFPSRAFGTAGTPEAGATSPAGGFQGARATAAAEGTPVPGATFPAGGFQGARATAAAGTAAAGGTPSAGAPIGTPTPQSSTPPAGAAPSAAATPQATATAAVSPEPGMNATVIITVEQARNVLEVPDRAIQTEGGNSVVEVRKSDGSTETVVVQTGLSDGTNTEIKAGLEEGQTVILPTLTGVTTSAQATTTTRTGGGGFFFGDGGPGGGPITVPGGGGD